MSRSRKAVVAGYAVRVFAEASRGSIGNGIFIKASGTISTRGFLAIDKDTTGDVILDD